MPPVAATTEPTRRALDWNQVSEALVGAARTPMGAARARALVPCPDLGEVLAAFDATDELRELEGSGTPLLVGPFHPIGPTARRAEKGERLDAPELRRVGITLGATCAMGRTIDSHAEAAPTLAALAAAIDLDPGLPATLHAAFDATGALSSATYPQLKTLRRAVQDLHQAIRQTLDDLVGGDELGEVLQDRFVTQRAGRYVLPVKAHAKRWDLGIVHGVSATGRTVFVEPKPVVELGNRLRIAEATLAAEEERILAELSALVGSSASAIEDALAVVATIDLAAARSGLADALQAHRPVTRNEGTLHLIEARHPVLALRGVDVVPIDLQLDHQRSCLVITGPNAGGKTITLKTVGLCAELVRHGCFVPAAEGSRVDLFHDVRALIGDHQGVMEDLSSFSGHLTALRDVLAPAEDSVLMLLDELGGGTDPSQGGALAQAVVEHCAATLWARLVTTTHYPQPKALGFTDDRVDVAAVEYAGGRPTYRLRRGHTGESHALETAARIGLDQAIVDRAWEIAGDAEQQLAAALAAAEHERMELAEQRRRQRAAAAGLEDRAANLAEREAKLAHRRRELEGEATSTFLDRLRQAERTVGGVVAELQRQPDMKRAQAARATVTALRAIVPSEKKGTAAQVRVGDHVAVPRFGRQVGRVLAVGPKKLTVELSGKSIQLDRTDVEPTAATKPTTPRRSGRRKRKGPSMTVDRAVRVGSNTVDTRGMRVDEGLVAIDAFLDRALLAGHEAIFVLHGHGTGAMKQAVRRHLPSSPYVHRCGPASNEQGGDAFTVAVLQHG